MKEHAITAYIWASWSLKGWRISGRIFPWDGQLVFLPLEGAVLGHPEQGETYETKLEVSGSKLLVPPGRRYSQEIPR